MGASRIRSGPKFYAVRTGAKPGIYHTYDDCLAQVKGFKKAVFKSFPTLSEAEAFVKGEGGPSAARGGQKFYAVHRGVRPGVYTTWDEAKKQVTNTKMPVFKSFQTQEDAEAFVKNGPAEKDKKNGSRSSVITGAADEIVIPASVAKRRISEVEGSASKTKTPAAKKQKKATTTEIPVDEEEELDESVHTPGTGPLPPGAEDGFDPRIILTPCQDGVGTIRGAIEYKDYSQRDTWKMQPIGIGMDTCVDIYTDGSCKNNGKQGKASAGWGVYFGPYDDRNMSGPLPGERQTNQRAELLAIQRAFEVAPKSHHIRVITDSRYAISCITDWSKRWKLNDWKTAEGKSVENKDLIEPIIKLVDERSLLGVETRFVWTKGHAGNEGNEAADKLAVAGALLPQDSHIVVHAEVELDGQSEGVLDDELGTDPEPVPHEEDVDATFETALQEVVREDAGRPRDEVPESSQTTRAEERVAVDVVDNGESVTVEDATERREATAEL